MILVTGATGKVGIPLVAQLQAQQVPFRALAHSPASYEGLQAQHVNTVLLSEPSVADQATAFSDVDRLFLLTPGSANQAAIEADFVDAARRAGVRHIVKLSVFGVEDQAVSLFRGHRESERYIQQSGLEYTFLRPNLFMQNLDAVDAASIRAQSAIFNSAGDGAMSFIDTRDIAAVAVAVLQGEGHSGQAYDLTGREALTYGDVALKLSTLLERPINYVALSDEAYRDALVSAQLPEWYAEGLAELYRFYREGQGAHVTDLVEQLTDQPARTIDTYLADRRELFA